MKKLVTERIYLNPERDAVLLEWLAQQKSKSAAMRQALWAYLQTQTETPTLAPAQAVVDAETIYQAVNEALTAQLDLSAIRQVVEAAVGNALSGLALVPAARPTDETEAILEGLDSHLVVD